MEKTGSQALVLLSILIVGLCNVNFAEAYPWTKVHAVFAFGDSLVDSGTNNFIEGSVTRANYLPYGESFFHWGTGRFTNGRHAFDFIASWLGLPFMPPFLKPGATFEQGVNFGSAGSGVFNTTSFGYGVNPLSIQVSQFQEVATKLTNDLGKESADNLISSSLFIFITGSNDLSAYLSNSSLQHAVNATQYLSSMLSELEGHAQTVYSLGARKVVFFGIGPLGCAPEAMAAANGTNFKCVDAPNQLAKGYNGALLQLVEVLNSKLPNLHAVMANPFETIEGLVINGSAKGFTEGSNACCGTGPFNGAVRCGPNNTSNLCDNVENFVFWDVLHPTERVYRRIAKLAWGGDGSFIQPMNLKTLVQL
ncbi:unnamed protein product [Calypogeia fissa]